MQVSLHGEGHFCLKPSLEKSMLYAMQDAAAKAMAPVAQLAQIGSWFTDTFVPASPLQRQTQAQLRLLTRLTKTYDKPTFGITSTVVNGREVKVVDEVHSRLPFCELRHFRKECAAPGPQLLIIAPLSGHHATLLRGTVEALLPHHDVFITDWVDARQVSLVHGTFDLSDYANYVQHFVRELGPDVHLLAVCQPCVPTLAAISLMEQNKEPVLPKSLTLIAGPVDVRSNPTAVNRFATERDMRFFENQLVERVPVGYPGFLRRVYPGFKQLTGFVMMNRDKHAEAYADYYKNVSDGRDEDAARHEKFYDEYNAVLDMPAEYYLETIAKVFMTPELALGELHLCGQRVDPSAIRNVALLTIEGDKDDITGLGQTHAAQTLCTSLKPSQRRKLTVEGVGHYGAFSGSKFKSVTVPVISEFIKKHT
jgi:poly(3-hydroxybutyrate) depolymerase